MIVNVAWENKYMKNLSDADIQNRKKSWLVMLHKKCAYLIVVRAVCGLLHRCVLLVISNLHTHHRVHVEPYELSGLDHRDADLMRDIKRDISYHISTN